MNKKLIIDIILKANDKQLASIAKKTKEILSKVKPEINFDENEFINEANGLKKILQDLKVDIPLDKPTQQVAKLSDRFAKLSLVIMGVQQASQSISEIAQPFVQLDTATNKIKTLGGEAKKIAPALRNMAIEMSKNIPIAAQELQTATYDALSAGINATKEDVESFMTAASQLAVGGSETIGNSVNLLSSLVNAYGESAKQTAKYSDYLFTTVNLGKTSIPELNAGLSQVVPTASAAGIAFKNIGASLALMTANGIPTAQATTKLNALLIELQKPGSNLAKVLKKAGVSIASLKNDTLPDNLEKIKIALASTGKTATQAFSSSEAGAAFNVLSKNISKFKNTLSQFDDASGTTKAAFDDMSISIENRSASMEAKLQAFSISAIDSMGDLGTGVVLATKGLGTMTPYLMSLASIKAIIPPGAISSVGRLGKSIFTQLIPSLIAGESAQSALNMTILANPYVLAIAGVAALATGIYFLADALHKSAKEKLEDAKADEKLIDSAIKVKKQQIELAESKSNLLEQFKNEGEAAMKDNDLLLKLAQTYPGLIDLTKSYADNLKSIKNASNNSKKELKKLYGDLSDLQQRKWVAQVKVELLNYDVAKEKLKDLLDPSFWSLNPGAIANESKKLMSEYVSAIDTAENSTELQNASTKFQLALLNTKVYDSKQKQKMLDVFNDMLEARKAAIEKANKNIPQAWDEYMKQGLSAQKALGLIAQQYNLGAKTISDIIKSSEQKNKLEKENVDLGKKTIKTEKSKKTAVKNTKSALVDQYLVAKSIADIARDNLENELRLWKLAQDKSIIEQNRKRNSADDLLYAMKSLEIQKKINAETIKAYSRQKLIIKKNNEWVINPSVKFKSNEKNALEKQLKKMSLAIKSDNNNVLLLKAKVKFDDQELSKMQKKLDLKIYELKFELNPNADTLNNLISIYRSTLESVRADIDKNNNAISKLEEDRNKALANSSAEETENIKLQYKAQIDALKKKNINLLNNEIDVNNKINNVYKSALQKRLDDLNDYYNQQEGIIKSNINKQKEGIENFANEWSRATSVALDKANDKELKSIEKSKNSKLKSLDDLHNKEIISDEYYYKRKSQIEENARNASDKANEKNRRDKLRIEALSQGLLFEQQNQADISMAQLRKERYQKEIDELKALKEANPDMFSAADQKQLDNLKEKLDDANKIIQDKSDLLKSSLSIMKDGITEGLTDLFAGDSADAEDAMRKTFSKIFGTMVQALNAQIDTAILNMVLSLFNASSLDATPWYVKLALVPVVESAAHAAIFAIANPVINKLLSFSSGGRIDEPTLALVGDASRLGAQNREWIFNDPQLIATVQMASASQNAELVKELRDVKNLLASQTLETKLSGDTISLALRRNQFNTDMRAR